VNEKFAPVLEEYDFRNFWATEIRVADGKPYFIDPTIRMPGQTGEQLMNTCTNLADVIWYGANGELIEPEFRSDYAAAATMHYTGGNPDDWKTIVIPDKLLDAVKLTHCLKHDGAYHFPPARNDEVGVLVGEGDTAAEAIADLQEIAEELKGEPISMRLEEFPSILASIHEADAECMDFGKEEVPEPLEVLKETT